MNSEITSASLAKLRNEFKGGKNTEELTFCLRELLPIDETEYKIESVIGNSAKFKALVHLQVGEDNIDNFVHNYQQRTGETIRKKTSRFASKKNEYVSFHYYRCHHKTYHQPTMNPKNILKSKPSRRLKNTDCPFMFIIKIKKNPVDSYLSLLDIEWNHNHTVKGLQVLTFRDIPVNISESIKTMFEKENLTPALAYRVFLRNLKRECSSEEEFQRKFADRSLLPRRRDFNQLYTEFKSEKYGASNISSMFSKLKSVAEEIIQKDTECVLKYLEFDETDNTPFVLVVVTPLMKRVHSMIPTSGELVFVDSTGGMEEFNLRIFLFVTHCDAGALPLALVILSDETVDSLIQAFDLLKEALPKDSFGDRGINNGPAAFMTDNCAELRDALKSSWPNSQLYLCSFHLLQQIWRWLFDTKHDISSADRTVLLKMFRNAMMKSDEEAFEEAFEDLIENDVTMKYKDLVRYFEDLYEFKEDWAHCFRKDKLTRGNNTNNAVESQFLVLKDEILNRTREININALLPKLIIDFNDHFKTKLLGIAVGKFDGVYSKRFRGLEKKKGELVGFSNSTDIPYDRVLSKLKDLGTGLFEIGSFSSEEKTYVVDMNAGVCQCNVGQNGSVCKHQYLIWSKGYFKAINFLPYFDSVKRQMYANIATGSSMNIDFYEGLHDRLIDFQNCNQSDTIAQETQIATPLSLTQEYVCEETPSNVTCKKDIDTIPTNSRRSVETMTTSEVKTDLEAAFRHLSSRIDLNCNNSNFLQGVTKFCQRVNKFPLTKLSSALHSFGVMYHTNVKITANSSLKRAKKGKIFVQPEAVKRRKIASGSKNSRFKGKPKLNPFLVKAATKRRHKFADNVEDNSPAPKKAGRTMFSKTKHKNKTTN